MHQAHTTFQYMYRVAVDVHNCIIWCYFLFSLGSSNTTIGYKFLSLILVCRPVSICIRMYVFIQLHYATNAQCF